MFKNSSKKKCTKRYNTDLIRVKAISSGDGPDSEEVTKQTFPTTVGGLVGLNQPAVNALSKLRYQYMRISYGRIQGSGYNARTGNNVSICPGAAKKAKQPKTIFF